MSISFLRKFLVLLSLFVPGCAADAPDVPVEALAAPPLDATSPPPVSIGVTPCVGWSWALSGTPTSRCSNDGSVSFHGGTWTMAPSVEPGRTLLGVTVVLSAPTGHAGDPVVFDVILRSSASPQIQLAEQQVAVTGAQQTVTLTVPARIVAAGETFQIVVLPLTSSGAYPTSDTTIWSAGYAPAVNTIVVPVIGPRVTSPLVAQWVSVGGQGSASHWAYVSLPLPVGTSILAVRARVQDAGSGTKLRERLLQMSDTQEQFSVAATSQPSSGTGVDETIVVTGPITTAPGTQYVLEVGNAANPSNLDSKLFRVEVDIP